MATRGHIKAKRPQHPDSTRKRKIAIAEPSRVLVSRWLWSRSPWIGAGVIAVISTTWPRIHIHLAVQKNDALGAFVRPRRRSRAQNLALFPSLRVLARGCEHQQRPCLNILARGRLTRDFDTRGSDRKVFVTYVRSRGHGGEKNSGLTVKWASSERYVSIIGDKSPMSRHSGPLRRRP